MSQRSYLLKRRRNRAASQHQISGEEMNEKKERAKRYYEKNKQKNFITNYFQINEGASTSGVNQGASTSIAFFTSPEFVTSAIFSTSPAFFRSATSTAFSDIPQRFDSEEHFRKQRWKYLDEQCTKYFTKHFLANGVRTCLQYL
ncbi:hypothetical protein AVEN_115541-1 [Araneus ventricosus]|uniref:Uncharacterized protein n=1 Tax=Araneus ventricosus TaxID=182803 RepID=A0A4Y2CII7_ARAVE|nr:hypothetical protein AVEN_115541-1 [Araneus ventricosus]